MPRVIDGENAEPMDAPTMRAMLTDVGNRLTRPVEIAATGGGVLLLAYHYSGSTPDLDSIIRSSEDAGAELSLVVDEVASDYGFGPR